MREKGDMRLKINRVKSLFTTLLSIFLLSATLVGCSSNKEPAEKVAKSPKSSTKQAEPAQTSPSESEDASVKADLEKYINKLAALGADEEKAVQAYTKVTGSNYQSDEILYNALNDTVIPTYEKFVDALNSYTSATDVVHQINQKYIDGANKQYQAFLEIRTAVQQQDKSMVDDANNLLSQAVKDISDFRFQLSQACTKYNVTNPFE